MLFYLGIYLAVGVALMEGTTARHAFRDSVEWLRVDGGWYRPKALLAGAGLLLLGLIILWPMLMPGCIGRRVVATVAGQGGASYAGDGD